MPEIVILSVAVLLASLVISVALNAVFVKYGRKDREPDMHRRIHVKPTGTQGGIAIYLTLLLVVGGGMVAVWVIHHLGSMREISRLQNLAGTIEGGSISSP